MRNALRLSRLPQHVKDAEQPFEMPPLISTPG